MTTYEDDNNGEEESDVNRREGSLSLDTILSLLAHHHRRDLFSYLVDAPDQTYRLDECAEYLLKQDAERPGELPQQTQVEADLHHVHIPKLRDVGILEYDPRTQELRYWGHDYLETCLDRVQSQE